MAIVLKSAFDYYHFLAHDIADTRTYHFPLMGSPIPAITLIVLYVWIVFKAGPAFMKNREPYKLDKFIQLYNIFQVVACAYIAYRGTKEYVTGATSFTCGEIDYSDTPAGYEKLTTYYMYVVMKYVDFIDTIIFVLRKKNTQITFLHVYHHGIMAAIFGILFRYVAGGHVLYLGTVNSFVHSVMYMYYFLSNYNKEYRKSIWWKKHLTQLQIVQFLSMLVHAIGLFQEGCNYPKVFLMALLPQHLFVTCMFIDFYIKTYVNVKKQ